jgi:hypothetical protein
VKLGDGTPVVGAQVNAQKDNPQAQPQEMNAGGMNSWTMTGSGGRFKLTGLGTGLFRINVSGDWQGELNIRSKRTDPIASGSADVKIVVDTGGLITGRVTDPQKKGLAGIWIYANPEQKDGKQPEGAEPRNVRTRDDGTFQVAGLSDVATYQLTVQANQGWDMSGGGGLKNAVLKGITVGTANLEVVLEEGLTITGTVVDAEGKPVANSYLQAMLMNADGKGSRMSRNAMTDDKGAFTISGLETGDCQISMMEWGGPGGQLIIQNGDKVPAGSRDVQLVASKGLTITGTVVDESNSAVKGAGISANPKTGGRSRSGRVNQDGTFEITGLAAGTSYKLMANAQGRALGKADDVASGSAGVRLVCPKGLEAAGRVTDEAGSPVKSAQIMLTLPTDTDYRAWAQTDDQGNFKVTGLVDGVYDATCTQRSGPNRNQRKCGVVKAGDMSAALQLVAEGK